MTTADMPPDPFVANPPAHTCQPPAVPTETLAEIMAARFRRIDECLACALKVSL